MTFRLSTTAAVTEFCIAWLHERGFACYKTQLTEQITLAELAKRTGMHANTLHKRLKSRECPDYPKKLRANGKLLWLQPTDELYEFLRNYQNH